LHTHAPLTQTVPAAHAALAPHAQAPAAEQLSAMEAPHFVHAPPLAPQVAALGT
jgi:hypothetical protein